MFTFVYASNQLVKRRELWKHIQEMDVNNTEAWYILGDFENVLSHRDRIGGVEVSVSEYIEL